MNLLLTSTGRRSYLIEYFKEALKGIGTIHAANSEMTYALSLADKYVISPSIYDESYIPFLLNYCEVNEIKAIVSLFDIDLPKLAMNKEAFLDKGIFVVVSNPNTIEICNDKWLTYQFLKDNGINTPLTYIELNTCKNALKTREIEFPLIIKPRWGMGSIGIFEAENELELDVLVIKTQKTISRTYLKFESNADIERSVIIQEKIKGSEYGIDVFNDLDGKYICSIAKRKLAMRAGETDIAQIISEPKLEDLGRKLSRLLGHISNLDVDCFQVGNEFCVLEMNCRFGGQYPFSHLAGANFPKSIIDMLQKRPIDPTDFRVNNNTVGYKNLEIKKITI